MLGLVKLDTGAIVPMIQHVIVDVGQGITDQQRLPARHRGINEALNWMLAFGMIAGRNLPWNLDASRIKT